MKKRFKWEWAIIAFCIVMALNIGVACAEYSNESPPSFIYYLAYIVDYPSIWLVVLFQKIPFPRGDDAGFQFLTVSVVSLFSALVWAVLVGFIFCRKSAAENTE